MLAFDGVVCFVILGMLVCVYFVDLFGFVVSIWCSGLVGDSAKFVVSFVLIVLLRILAFWFGCIAVV